MRPDTCRPSTASRTIGVFAMMYRWTHDPLQREFASAEECEKFFCEEPVNLLNGDDGYVEEIEDEVQKETC